VLTLDIGGMAGGGLYEDSRSNSDLEIRKSFINGHWLPGEGSFCVSNPSDRKSVVGEYYRASAADVAMAVEAGAEAARSWGEQSPSVRSAFLDAIANGIAGRRDLFARTLAQEEGKSLREAGGEVERAIAIFRFYSGEALRNWGEWGPSTRAGVDIEVRREPVGVLGLITPWNFPIAIPAWKTAPALAFGNTVVLKVSDVAPGCAWLLSQVIEACKLPAGVFNLVLASGSDAGRLFVQSSQCDAISFTGSASVGGRLAEAASRHKKRIQLEMGGKNPLVVLDDANLEQSVEVAVNSAYFQTGQRCTAASRIIVTAGIYEDFVERFVARLRSLRVGHALDPNTEIGPVATAEQLDTNQRYLDAARHEGVEVVGGQLLAHTPEGLYMRPAAMLNTSNTLNANREEIFGPIAGVIKASDYEHSLTLANDTDYGLCAGICTQHLGRAADFRRRVRAGMVMVNLPTAGVDHHVPFGGTRGSSFGPREQGTYAREFYTLVKTAYIGY